MHYRLRTLLILLAVGPPVLAGVWPAIQTEYKAWRQRVAWRAAVQSALRVKPTGGGFTLRPKDRSILLERTDVTLIPDDE